MTDKDVPIGTRELRLIDDTLFRTGDASDAAARELLLELYRYAYREGVAQTLRQHADHDRTLIAVEHSRIRTAANDYFGPGFAGKVTEMLAHMDSGR